MEYNSGENLDSLRGGFGMPMPIRAPRTRIGPDTNIPPAQDLPVKKVQEQRQSDLRRQDVKAKPQPQAKRAKVSSSKFTSTKTSTKSNSSKEKGRRPSRTKVLMGAGKAWAGGYGGRPPGSPPQEEGQPGESFPTGEVEYLGGPRVTLPSEKFDGISEIDQLDQTDGEWSGTPSQIRTLIQSFNFQPYPNYSGQLAGATSNVAALASAPTTQDEIFQDKFAGIQQYYCENYNANTAFENNFKEHYFYYYQFDVNRLHAEYVCLLQRAAYYQSESSQYTENAAVEKIANILNTTNFYPVRNKMARALKRQFISREIRDEHYEIFQTNRLTPHETGGTIFNVTDRMLTLLDALSDATNTAQASVAFQNYATEIELMCDYVLYGRPVQVDSSVTPSVTIADYMIPKREFSGSLYNLYGGSNMNDTIYSTVRRNAMSAILERVSGSRGPFDFVKLNYQERGNSMSLYDPAFCDRFNNTQFRYSNTFYPPSLNGGSSLIKAANSASPYYVSERSSDNQDCRTAFHMLLNFTGESPLFYSHTRLTGNSRKYLKYVGRKAALTNENLDLSYELKDNFIQVGYNSNPPVQDNYVTKMYYSDALYSFTQPDGDGSPLFFVTYSRVVEKFKRKYMVNK